MTRADPGISFRSMTLEAAWSLLTASLDVAPAAQGQGADVREDNAREVIEAMAEAAGLRARRVILDTRWWNHAGAAMLARLAERRRQPRGQGDDPAARGWVALLPHAFGGYRMRALDPRTGAVIEWRVDAALAARLAPHAYTFPRCFPDRPLGPRDLLAFAFWHGRRDLALLMACGIGIALATLVTPVATGWIIDRAIPSGRADRVTALLAGVALAGVALVALDLLRSLAVTRFETRLGVSLQAALVDRVLAAPTRFLRGFASGDLALRIGAVNTLQRTLLSSALGSIVTFFFVAANAMLMLRYSVALSTAAFGMALLVAAVSTGAGLLRLRLGPRIEALDGAISALTYELFVGIPKLRAAGAEARALERWYGKYDTYRSLVGASARLANWETVALGVLQPAATALVLYLAWRLSGRGALSTGDFVAFHAAMFAMLGGVHALVAAALEVVNLPPVWQRARPILETLPEDGPGRGEPHAPLGAIALRGVSFAYADGEPVLHGVDLDIAPGEFLAIVGPSGSGKSTLIRLLLGFEDPVRGRIEYDGRDLRTLDRRRVRRAIGTVLQGGRLWEGDLYTNIAGAASVSVDAAWDAARAAGVADDIEAMPMGMYTRVGEALSTLSGGQRQRVLIARALAARPRILLLDEATSALDNLSQAKVLESLRALDATRVVIAHRLETVRHADRIVVLDGGRVVQEGTFAELAERTGLFAALLERQIA